MKKIYSHLTQLTFLTLSLLFIQVRPEAQTCSTAQGNQTTYGANNVWIGYVYTGMTLNSSNYQGDFTIGTATSPNFNTTFTSSSTFSPNGCTINTTDFSVRYRLTQTYASGTYTITVGGDDGYRFSTDGGSTWVINNWNDQSYTTSTITVTLSGSYNFVLEYYQDGGIAQVSFNIAQVCMGTGVQTTYGTNNTWIGYIYQGMGFQTYKGTVSEGGPASSNFNESFGNPGGSNSNTYSTNQCSVTTYQFSAIYMLAQTLPAGNYTFVVGGDDGYRLSLDGGSTWVISNWADHAYTTSSYTTTLSAGTYNTVLEYYQDGGYDQISYTNTFTTLPITVDTWSAKLQAGDKALLNWTASNAIDFDHFVIERTTGQGVFEDIATVPADMTDSSSTTAYSYTDQFTYNGDVFYRLKLVDRDGTVSYSTIVDLPMQASPAIRIYPTMVENGQVTVESPAPINQARVQVFDMTGRILMDKEWSELQGRQQVAIAGNNGHLPAGTYIVRLSDAQSQLARQLIIVK